MAKKVKGDDKDLKEKEEEVATDETFEDDEAGFGGLPDRDLKKNLGCG